MPTFYQAISILKGADITPFIETITPLFDADAFFNSDIDYACMTVNFTRQPTASISKAKDGQRSCH